MAEIEHSGSGDIVGRDKIERQTNLGSGGFIQIINYHGDRKVGKHLTPPPFRPEVFLGREDELNAIHHRLFSDNKLLLLVNGEGGVGKTSLASTYYRRYEGKYQHLAWVLSEKSILHAILSLARPLGVEFDPTSTAQERLPWVLQAMSGLPAPCLLVIDNANELEDLEQNYAHLRRCDNFHVLLTTRITEFRKAAHYKIEGLPLEKSLELFKEYFPGHLATEDELFAQVHRTVLGNTLVVELFAKNLHLLNQVEGTYRLPQLLNDLEGKGILNISTARKVDVDYQGEGRKEWIRDIVAGMYDLGALTEAEQTLLSVFAVLPAENIALKWLEALIPSETLRPTLLSLAQKGWLDHQQATSTFRVSPVVQEVTRHKNQARLFADCGALIDALIEKLKYDSVHITGSSYEDAAYYARLGEAIVPCFAAPEEKVAILCDRLGNFQRILGDLTKALEFFERSLSVDKALHEAFPSNVSFKNGLAISYSKLGETQTALGDLNKALEFYTEQNRLGKELHEAFPSNVDFKNNLAISYQFLGSTHTALGDMSKALEFYTERNRLGKELYEAFPNNVGFKNGLAVSYCFLGNTHTALADLTLALERYRDYHSLSEELHEAFPSNVNFKNNLAISYEKLGNTHTALGDLNQALEFYTVETKLFEELHEAFPGNVKIKNGLAISYWKLGNLSRKMQDVELARKHFTQAQQLLTELVKASPATVQYQRNLAQVQHDLKNLEK